MIMSTTKKAALGAVAALVAAIGTVGAAEAHGFCKHHMLRSHLFVSSYDDCSLYKYKWLKTGKLFWQMKYMKCIARSY
jgi:hypothetical protein